MDKETKIKLLNKQIEVYKSIVQKFEKAIPVVESFNAKVLNVKLDRALKEIDGSIGYNSGHCTIFAYTNDRSIKTDRGDSVYVDCYKVDVAITLDDTGKRIVATETISNIKEQINTINKRIKCIEDSISSYDNMVREYNNIKESIKDFKNKYDYIIRRDFDL